MFYFMLIAVFIILDQLSKYAVVQWLKPIRSFPIIENILHFTYAENTGAAFSMLSGRQFFLIALTALAMGGMAFYLYIWSLQPGEIYQKLALSMIIGGGIGNLVDRIRQGYVVDFIDVRAINFAIFNVADSFIVVGSILLAILIIFDVKR